MSNALGLLAKFATVKAVCQQQGRGHARAALDAAGRTARFEQGQFNVPGPGNGQGLPGPEDELAADIHAISIDHRSPAGQDIVAVAADNIGWRSWRGQTAELFWTDGQPIHAFKQGQTGWVGFAFAVIAGAQTGKAGADQAGFFQESSSGRPDKQGKRP